MVDAHWRAVRWSAMHWNAVHWRARRWKEQLDDVINDANVPMPVTTTQFMESFLNCLLGCESTLNCLPS
jgi:hypothetical protein